MQKGLMGRTNKRRNPDAAGFLRNHSWQQDASKGCYPAYNFFARNEQVLHRYPCILVLLATESYASSTSAPSFSSSAFILNCQIHDFSLTKAPESRPKILT